ncbi:MAG: hypothetical protein IT379_42405, partial [Deltaproteobacteria bacterium]|nr:hypothetical protein [Deltaproteobacteria bacterium]
MGRLRADLLAVGLSAVALGAAAGTARAVPGPDSVAVVASSAVPESVALAERYVAARQVPRSRLCVLDLPVTDDVSVEVLRDALIEPLRACLGDAMEHVEAVVLVRGVPLRVDVGADDGCGRASVAAALGAWGSTLADGTPLLGHAPGRTLMCAGGVPCCGARFANPFRTGVFAPGWSRDTAEGTFRPLLVTMLHGRTYEDAARLIDSAIAAEAPGAARGQMLFMDGADPARGSLDATYDAVIAGLADRGIADVARVPFDPDLTGRTLSAFFVGTASLGT